MMAAVYAYNVLTNRTSRAQSTSSALPTVCPPAPHWHRLQKPRLRQCCRSRTYRSLRRPDESGGKGLKGDAAAHTRALLAEKQPLEVVDEA